MEQSKMKKVLTILLAILFVVSLTAVAVDAQGGNGGQDVGSHTAGLVFASQIGSGRADWWK
jgi:hypothetical protein